MALNDNAVLTAAVGYVYTAAVGTAAPTAAQLSGLDPLTPSGWTATGWDMVGHTSRNDMPEFGFDGGDTEVKGTWQKKKLREVQTSDLVDSLSLKLQQWDESSLELYYGTNASATAGEFAVSGTFAAFEKAFLIIIVDGDFRIAFHASKASIKRDDAIDLPVDDFASLPIKVTFLNYSSDPLFKWINEDLFNAVAGDLTLNLHGATGGTFTLRVNGVATGSISVSGISAATIKTALVAVDDGLDAADFTVTGSGPYVIVAPAEVTLGTDSSTGGSGITLALV